MSVQHANRGIVKKDLQLYYNREFVKSFRGEATINTCDLNTRYNYVSANAVATRDTTAPSTPPITGFEIAKLRSTDGQDAQTILYTAAVDQVNGGVYTHSAYIYLESGTWVSVGQHWNPWDYGVQTYIPLNKWTRVSYTVTNSAANYGQVACSYNTNGVVYITATQYERKSYSTPFVASTLWTPNLVNVTSTSGHTTMTKNQVGNGWTNARVYSTEGYNAPCYVSFKASQTSSAAIMIGLNSDPATGINYTNLDYAFYLDNPGYTAIYESGTSPVAFGNSTYTTSTIFEIIYDGTNINYYMDGVLKRTVARSGSGPLYLDSSFYSNGVAINSLSFGPLSQINRFSNTIAGGGGLLDISGNNYNINLTSSAIAFDSGGYYFNADAIGPLTTPIANSVLDGLSNNTHTYECWIKLLGTPPGANDGYFFGRQGFHEGYAQFKSPSTTFGCLSWYFDNTNTNWLSYAGSLNIWYHTAYVVDVENSIRYLYINGAFNSSGVLTKQLKQYASTTAYHLGAAGTSYSSNSIISSAKTYNRALTAAEVLQNFNATRKTYGI